MIWFTASKGLWILAPVALTCSSFSWLTSLWVTKVEVVSSLQSGPSLSAVHSERWRWVFSVSTPPSLIHLNALFPNQHGLLLISSALWLRSKLLLQQNSKFSFPLKPPAWQLATFSTVIDLLCGTQIQLLSLCHPPACHSGELCGVSKLWKTTWVI